MSEATLRAITVYYDYTCRYSYRAMHWLDRVRAARPGFEVTWKTFSLKEVNRDDSEPSWVAADSPPSISVLALALAHAVRAADFDRYHHAVFEAMHGEERKLGDADLLALGADAGVRDFDRPRWTEAVGREHHQAVEEHGVYGTPTLVFGTTGAYLRLTELPSSDEDALGLFDSLAGVARAPINLVEVFLPERPMPVTPVQIETLTADSLGWRTL